MQLFNPENTLINELKFLNLSCQGLTIGNQGMILESTHILVSKKQHLKKEELKLLQYKIDELVVLTFQKSKGKNKSKPKTYFKVVGKYFRRFEISTFSELPRDRYDEAIHWIDSLISLNKPYKKLPKPIDTELLELCDSIYKRAKTELKMHKYKVHNFAYWNLHLPERIIHLKKLDRVQLSQLEKKLFNI